MGEDVGDVKQDGRELFRELIRNFPTAKVEDYFKSGRWLKDTMSVDIELVTAHRRESGAPEPPPLEEIEMPELPADSWSSRPLPPAPAAPLQAPARYGTPAAPSRPALTPQPPKTAPSPANYSAQADLGGKAQMELRLIASFVQKWKLDPTRTKLLLAKLTPTRRRQVIDNFEAPSTNGLSPTAALERFIAQGDSGRTPSAASPRTSASTPKAPPKQISPAPVKRAYSGGAAEDGEAPKRSRPAGYSGTAPTPSSRPTSASSYTAPRAKEAAKPATTKTGGGSGVSTLGAKPGDLIKNLLGGL